MTVITFYQQLLFFPPQLSQNGQITIVLVCKNETENRFSIDYKKYAMAIYKKYNIFLKLQQLLKL